MDKEKERMNQSSDVVGLNHPMNRFLISFAMLRDPHDEWFDEWMEQLRKSAAYLIAHNEDMKRRGYLQRDVEQNRLNGDAFFRGFACEKLTATRIVKAGTARLRKGEQGAMSEADKSAIQREAESEINHLWERSCKMT